jgi:long-subunit fatty acid transport protein
MRAGASVVARALRLAVAVAATVTPTTPWAAPQVGGLFAEPTEPGPASTFLGPAALTRARGTGLWLDGNVTFIAGSYQRDGVDGATGISYPRADLQVAKPEIAATLATDALHPRLRLALGVTLPFVDGAQWPATTPTSSGTLRGPTVYHVEDGSAVSWFITPAIAVEVLPWLSLGVGVNVIYTQIEKRFAKDMAGMFDAFVGAGALAPEQPDLLAQAHITGGGFGVGATCGIEVTPSPSLRLALSYTSGSTSALDARLDIGQFPLMERLRSELASRRLSIALSGSGTLTWYTPQVVNAGLVVAATQSVEVGLDFQWVGLSSASLIGVEFDERSSNLIPRATVATRLHNDEYLVGGRVVAALGERARALLRVAYDFASVPDDLLTPANLNAPILGAGFGLEVAIAPAVTAGVEYTHFFVLDREVTHSRYAEDPNVAEPFNLPPGTGLYTATANRIGASLRWRL